MNDNNLNNFSSRQGPAANQQENLELFKEFLVDTLKIEDASLMEELNDDLVDNITDNEKFKKDLENALYNNQEKLTRKEFILDGKPARPTIANWLKDFLQKVGSGRFNNVILTQFVTNSENAKKLDDKERKILGDMLELYRNLKFFPESMAHLPPERWEIIPTAQPKEEIKREVAPLPKGEKEKELRRLREIAEQFPAGSLERKAVEEEIEKLEVRS